MMKLEWYEVNIGSQWYNVMAFDRQEARQRAQAMYDAGE